MTSVAGIDGCKGGWYAIIKNIDTQHCYPIFASHFDEIISTTKDCGVIAVDIPIGLLDAAERGGRLCDRVARWLLHPRTSCVFNPPIRAAVMCENDAQARLLNCDSSPSKLSLSSQSLGFRKSIRQVDLLVTPELQRRIKEVHPELSFLSMNGGRTLLPKKNGGAESRKTLLRSVGLAMVSDQLIPERPKNVDMHDVLDAGAAVWTAERILKGNALCIPFCTIRDSRGLSMAMWI